MTAFRHLEPEVTWTSNHTHGPLATACTGGDWRLKKNWYAHSVRKSERFPSPTASNPFAPLVLLQECRSELVSPVSPLLIFKSMALRIWNLEIIEKKSDWSWTTFKTNSCNTRPKQLSANIDTAGHDRHPVLRFATACPSSLLSRWQDATTCRGRAFMLTGCLFEKVWLSLKQQNFLFQWISLSTPRHTEQQCTCLDWIQSEPTTSVKRALSRTLLSNQYMPHRWNMVVEHKD